MALSSDYARVGESPKEGQSKKAFILDLSHLKPIDPAKFFITTGEAIVKMDYLIEQVKTLLNECKKTRRQLVKVKGNSKWLETCWEGDNKLLVKKKEARSRRK